MLLHPGGVKSQKEQKAGVSWRGGKRRTDELRSDLSGGIIANS